MKIVYIAHPISGNVKANLESIRQIVRHINLATDDIVPFAPYWLDCHALDDREAAQRERGIKNDRELFNRKFIDEVWVFGDYKISLGVMAEIKFAKELGIPVFYCEIKQDIQVFSEKP